jgi:hypothetical protein
MSKNHKSLINSKTFIYGLFLLSALLLQSCFGHENNEAQKSSPKVTAEYLHAANIALEQDIVHDFFSPPVAGRIYLYPNLIAYEIISQNNPDFNSLTTIIDGFPTIPKYKGKSMLELAALYSFLLVSREMLYTVKHVDAEIAKLDNKFKSVNELKEIKAYSDKVSKLMIKWLNQDNYNETRNMGEYQLLKQEGSWIPTPPDYMDALEPHWDKIRSITLESASQFSPPPPTKYDMTKGSQFHMELMEVYDAVNNRNDTTEAIAKFWDCNPIILRHEGHITYAEKKLTPGGHWMNICRMAAINENFDFISTAHANATMCIGMFDAFISCWEGKYTTNYIRPVTVIQNNIDPSWTPILITPNFPEYTSGHSVISRSVATILTYNFGENYAFTDSTEVPYGMPPRSFSSFIDASDEAAVSRFYAGIHYKPAIYDGVNQGTQVGQHVLSKIKSLKK